MRRLGVTDAGWLLVERPDRPMHVGGLLLFDPPPDAGPGFLRDRLIEPARRDHGVRRPFDQKLARPFGRAGVYHWVADEQLDLDVHRRHLAHTPRRPGRASRADQGLDGPRQAGPPTPALTRSA